MEFINAVEELFKTYLFTKELLLVLIYVVLGAVLTAIINNGAMKKQSKYNLQYEIIKRELDKIIELSKSIESLEIMISFSKQEKLEAFIEDIEKLKHMLFRTNESLRDNRKFVRKYISAKSVELSAQLASDYLRLMYDNSNGLLEVKLVDSLDANGIHQLRIISDDARKLENQLSEALEKLISPGLVSGLKRKFRKPLMFIEEIMAIRAVKKNRR